MLESLNIADRTLREHPEIKPHQEKLSDDKVLESCEALADLSIERAHLGHLLYRETGKPRAEQDKTPQTVATTTLEEELEAIKNGEFDRIATTKDEPKARIQEKLGQIETQIEDLVAYPQVVESYRKNLESARGSYGSCASHGGRENRF